MGSLYIDGNHWKVIAPTDAGPQPYQTGGEIVIWESKNDGNTWKRKKPITTNSKQNHTYVRRPDNAKNCFACFWADGDPTNFSKSYLYFSDIMGKQVYKLPYDMDSDFAKPIKVNSK